MTKKYTEVGKHLTEGFILTLGKYLILGFLISLALNFVTNLIGYGYDSTDGESRSGMILRVDALTGCHYLESSQGHLTPRLTFEGNQVCTGEE